MQDSAFQFDSILKFRKRELATNREEYHQAQQRLGDLDANLEALRMESLANDAHLSPNTANSKMVDIKQMQEAANYRDYLLSKLRSLADTHQQLTQLVTGLHAQMVASEQDLQAISKLHETHRATCQAAVAKRQQQQLDEFAALAACRNLI